MSAPGTGSLGRSSGGHRIEERAGVYLRLSADTTAWEIDATTLDGYALEGYDEGPSGAACECDDEAGCEAAKVAARAVALPNGYELAQLLVAELAARAAAADRVDIERRAGLAVCELLIGDALDGVAGPDEQDAAQSAITHAVEHGFDDDPVRVAQVMRSFRIAPRDSTPDGAPTGATSGDSEVAR